MCNYKEKKRQKQMMKDQRKMEELENEGKSSDEY
jgi:hypothetical protein